MELEIDVYQGSSQSLFVVCLFVTLSVLFAIFWLWFSNCYLTRFLIPALTAHTEKDTFFVVVVWTLKIRLWHFLPPGELCFKIIKSIFPFTFSSVSCKFMCVEKHGDFLLSWRKQTYNSFYWNLVGVVGRASVVFFYWVVIRC